MCAPAMKCLLLFTFLSLSTLSAADSVARQQERICNGPQGSCALGAEHLLMQERSTLTVTSKAEQKGQDEPEGLPDDIPLAEFERPEVPERKPGAEPGCDFSWMSLTTGTSATKNSWELRDTSSSAVVCKSDGVHEEDNKEHWEPCCLMDGVQYTIKCENAYGEGWRGGSIEVGPEKLCAEGVWSSHEETFVLDSAWSTAL
uniref:Uncharacterized protein n=1 Tax=Alexandrium catenella TaxID=2925 RepID=A0A7S1MNY1_ALECA|mmetsp:Transcript_30832/g.83526  ORF Transcript_30832/g.83526 Transcript_30832/m.83526 type:complete len:201 (+) Transcript_30832:67-669(+)